MTIYPDYQPFCAKYFGNNPPKKVYVLEFERSGLRSVGMFTLVNKESGPSSDPVEQNAGPSTNLRKRKVQFADEAPQTPKRVERAAADVISPARREASQTLLQMGIRTAEEIAKRAVLVLKEEMPEIASAEDSLVAEITRRAADPQDPLAKAVGDVKADPSRFDAFIRTLSTAVKTSQKAASAVKQIR